MTKVLILGHDSRSFLSVIRSLGRKKITVHVGWYKNRSIALYSKYIQKKILIPAYSPDNTQWLDVLIALIEEQKYDLVIPVMMRLLFHFKNIRNN